MRILVYVFADVNQTCFQEMCFFHTIYLSTAIGLTPGGSSSTHLHTNSTQNDTKQTIHRTTQQFVGVRAVPRLG